VTVEEPSVSAVLVTDDVVRDRDVVRARAIEIVAPRPRSALRAIANVVTGESQGIVLSDAPQSLCAALSLADDDVLIAQGVVSLSKRFPSLSARQDSILALIAQGRSTPSICRRLNISATCAKREIQIVASLLGVSGRVDLAAKAVALGFPARDLNDRE